MKLLDEQELIENAKVGKFRIVVMINDNRSLRGILPDDMSLCSSAIIKHFSTIINRASLT